VIVRRPFTGMGYDYFDLIAQSGMEQCSPMDPACVSRNVQRENAVEDYWINNGMTNPNNTAGTPAPVIQVNTNAAQAAQFASDSFSAAPGGNNPQTGGSITSGGKTYTDSQLEQAQGWATPFVRAVAPVSAPAPKPPSGSNVINSSGGNSAPPVIQNAQTGAVSSLLPSLPSSIPSYALWIGGGLLAFFALKGGR
jgi:hypothetical protein